MNILKWLFGDGEPLTTEDKIYYQYQQLKKTASGDKHADRYQDLWLLVNKEQDALYNLIFSRRLTEGEIDELIWFGGHGGSCAKRHNLNWVDFVARVRERQNELPPRIQSSLDWYLKVHGW